MKPAQRPANIERFLAQRRKKTWLWHRTNAKNLEEIKRKGIRPRRAKGLAFEGTNVEIINTIFDGERPRSIRLSRINSVFFDIPKIHKMRRAFWGMWATPEQKEEMKQHYARALVNPKGFFVGDMDIVTKAQEVLEKQEKSKKILSAKDISAESLKQIKALGKNYWANIVTLENFLKNYEWNPIPVGGYSPKSGKGRAIYNPEVIAKVGKKIMDIRISKGKV